MRSIGRVGRVDGWVLCSRNGCACGMGGWMGGWVGEGWAYYLLQYIYFPCKKDTKSRKENFSERKFSVMKCLRSKKMNKQDSGH